MLNASSSPIDHFPAFLARIPSHIDLEALARQSKVFRRARGVRSGIDLMRLALAWGLGGYWMQRIAAWAGERTIATLTEDALVRRLHAAGPFLEKVVPQRLIGVGEAPSWHGRVLRIADSTSLRQRGSEGTDWRVHGVDDLGCGGFTHLEVTDNRDGEALDRGNPVAGEIVRMRWSTVRLVDKVGDLFDDVAWLQARPRESEIHAIAAWARSGKRQTPMKIRLIVRRKPPEVIEAEHKRLRQQASRKQTRLDPRSLIAAEYVLLATSLPEGGIPGHRGAGCLSLEAADRTGV